MVKRAIYSLLLSSRNIGNPSFIIKKAMRKLLYIFSVFFATALQGQGVQVDALHKALALAKDSQRISILNELSAAHLKLKSGDALERARTYANEGLVLSRQLKFFKGIGAAEYNLGNIMLGSNDVQKQPKALLHFQEALANFKNSNEKDKIAPTMYSIAFCFHHMGAIQKAIRYMDSAKSTFLQLKDTISFANSLAFEGHCYYDMGNYRNAYQLGMDALKYAQTTNDTLCRMTALTHIANLFLGAGLPQVALNYFSKIMAYEPTVFQHQPIKHNVLIWALIIGGEAYLRLKQFDKALSLVQYLPPNNSDSEYNLFLGHLHTEKNEHEKALSCFKRGLELDYRKGLEISCSRYANEIGRTYIVLQKFDSARFYATKALYIADKVNALLEKKNAVGTLSDLFVKTKNYEQGYQYSQWYKKLNDSLAPEEYRQKLALVQVQNELETQKQQGLLLTQQNKIKEQQLSKEGLVKNILLTGVVLLLLFGAFVLRNNKQKQKANLQILQEKEKVETTLSELKATQAQLIQSEKMASLGELTAGIAHEIQNPLNFVNNFSELSKELLAEMKEELSKGNSSEVLGLADNVIVNMEKINHHGKRADAIVKGMLQHSRSSTGAKHPTDINQLVDEYLRLTYHGLRAKDSSFNAKMETRFDKSIEEIPVVPQELGRVFLNMFSNAFYAVAEKKKQQPEGYEPIVTVSTKRLNSLSEAGDKIEIVIQDNGVGIPQKVVDKIFQPFFTTKPTGEGTGLGLSLSYDIVKAHGGEIKLATKEREGTEFTIQLPS